MHGRGTLIYLAHITKPFTHNSETGACSWEEREQMHCIQCGKDHDALWTITRVPVAPFGHFIVYRLNGEKIVPDMSVPYGTEKIPRDAIKIESPQEFARVWHLQTGSHTFGW